MTAVAAAPGPLRVVVAVGDPRSRAGLTTLLDGRGGIRVVARAVDVRQARDAALVHRPDVLVLDARLPDGGPGPAVRPAGPAGGAGQGGPTALVALRRLALLAPVLVLTYNEESDGVGLALRLGAAGGLVHGRYTAGQLLDAVRNVGLRNVGVRASAPSGAAAGRLPGGGRPAGAGAAPGGGTRPGGGTVSAGGTRPAGGSVPGGARAAVAGARGAVVRPAGGRAPDFALHSQSTSSQSQYDVGPSTRRAVRRAGFGLTRREEEVMELIAGGRSNQQIAAACFISEKTVKNHINRIFNKLQAAGRGHAVAIWLATGRPGPVD